MLTKPFPLKYEVDRYLDHLQDTSIYESKHQKDSYLDTIETMVHYFYSCMDDEGRIIDPYMHRETQYSTPAFAAATALLYTQRKENWMLESASKALDSSLKQMVEETCADGHSNFYTTMVVSAYLKLKPHVSSEKNEEWKKLFSEIDPSSLYKKTINNWKVVALAGEWQRGINELGTSINQVDIDKELAPQMELLTEYGLYVDPNGPMAYAMFTRNYFRLMLLDGYNGEHKERLLECCQRGDLTSLFMQSPSGEMPTGGRSAQHQWNEAQQAFQFEVAANEYAQKGEAKLAAAFKRGARLSLESVNRWKRPTGELNVLRNYADPNTRTGYETYTYHTQYNLLAAYFLALAFEHSNEEVGEVPCPAEVGGFYIWMEPYFHKLIINAGGHYIEYQTKGDVNYTPTGIVRIQRSGVWPTIGPSDGSPIASERAISFAPGWRNSINIVTRLAEMTYKDIPDVDVKSIVCERNLMELTVSYRGPMNGAFLIERKLTLTPEILVVNDSVIGEIEELFEEFPLFAFDGKTSTTISCSGSRMDMDYSGNKVTIKVLDQSFNGFKMGPNVVPYRNGMLTSASYYSNQLNSQYVVHLYHSEEYIDESRLIDMSQRV
jgi:hypothetical protein